MKHTFTTLGLVFISTLAFAKETTKKKPKKDETTAASTTFSAVPLQKSSGLKSITTSNRAASAVDDVSGDNLLRVQQMTFKGGRAQIEKTSLLVNDYKKKQSKLGIGMYRSEGLSGGKVYAPGVQDFAAYLRSGDDKKSDFKGQVGSVSEDFLRRQQEAEKLRQQTVESIRQILLSRPNQETRIDLMIRLAEIRSEQGAYHMETEIKRFNEAHDKWSVEKKGAAPVFKPEKANAFLLMGVDSLRALVTQYPNHARSPEALFNLGFMLTQLENDSAALYFNRLVTRYPKSEYVPDAYLALGEYHFSKLKFETARENYAKVLNFKGKRAYNYAVYKLGWTYFNMRGKSDAETQKNLGKSLSAFKLIVKLAEEKSNDPHLRDLKKESLKDMVLVFAETKDIEGAQRYYHSLKEPELYFTFLERLAWQTAESGNYNEAASIYARVIEENPQSKKIPSYYASLADMHEKAMKRDNAVKTLAAMTKALSMDGAWMKQNKGQKEKEERDRLLGAELRGRGEKWHQEAQKTKRADTYNYALAAYDLYLSNFGETAESYKTHFFKGEILAHEGRFLDASTEYMKAVSLDEKFKIGGKHTKDAVTNAIISLNNVIVKMPAPKLPAAGMAKERIALPQVNERLVVALDTFIRLYPKDSQTLDFANRAAAITYAYGDYDNSNSRWTEIVKVSPKSKESHTGALLTVKVFVSRNDWDGSMNECRKFMAIPGVKETKLYGELQAVLKGSIFQKAIATEKTNPSAAADLFASYQKEFPSDKDADKALFNAANNRFKTGNIDGALTSLKIILTQYQTSKLVPNALYLTATSYDNLGMFSESAVHYERLADLKQDSNITSESIARATHERMASGEYDLAIKNGTRFIAMYPKHESVGDVWMTVARAYEAKGRANDASQTYMKAADAMQKVKRSYAVYFYGLAADSYFKQNNVSEATRVSNQGIQLSQAIPQSQKDLHFQDGVRLLATTQVAVLDAKLPQLYSMKVTSSTKLNAQFTLIKEEVAKLSPKYVAIARLGNAEAGVGALYRVAEMQEFLGNVLLKSPAPEGAKPQEVEQFKSALDKIALPLQEEAANLYMTAWQKAVETEAMTPFTRKLHEKLAQLRPTEFKKVVEEMPRPLYYSSDLAISAEVKSATNN